MRRFAFVLLALLVCLGVSLPAARAQEPVVHVVQRGENLYRISLRYGVSMDAIMAANGISDPNRLYAGQELVIPGAPAGDAATVPPAAVEPGGLYTVQPGDTLSGIAARHQVTVWTLAQANRLTGVSWVYVGQQLFIPAPAATPPPASAPAPEAEAEVAPLADTYVVQRGDTLAGIARRFNTTVEELAALNAILNPSTIYANQQLQLSATAPAFQPPASGKRILVNLSEQHLYAYQGEELVFSFVASSGAAPTYTRAGQFYVQSKIPNAYGASWDIWMPFWLGIYWAGGSENGIHALPILPGGGTLWAGYLGTPISYGCVVLGTAQAEQLYYWADLGTPVTIQY